MLNIENGLLTIGTIPSMPQYHITQFLAQFQKLYPETTVRITEDDPVNLMTIWKMKNVSCLYREIKLLLKKTFSMTITF